MTEETLPLAELLTKAGDSDFLRSVAESVLQLLMKTDVEGVIGAGRSERTLARATYRNGCRDRSLDALGLTAAPDPQAQPGPLLPALSGTQEDRGEGSGGGDAKGLDQRRVHPARR